MIKYTYFNEKEFTKCVPSCRSDEMNKDFMYRLIEAREDAGIPFILNSAYRSPEWDKSKGRSGTGYHTLGRAVDIKCDNAEARYTIIASLLKAGFTGIGIGKRFIHVDDRETKPIIWQY